MRSRSRRNGINKANLIAAIILAFVAWIYVMYNVDPSMSKTYRDVPVKLINDDIIAAKDLSVRSIDNETVDVTIDARRSLHIQIGNEGIEAFVDVARAEKGENELSVIVNTPGDAKLTSISTDVIKAYVDLYETRVVPLEIVVEDPDDMYSRQYIGPEEVTIVGFSDDLNKVKSIKTEKMDLSSVTEDSNIEIKYDLPEGVTRPEGYDPQLLEVYVVPRIEATIVVPASVITAEGLSEKFDCEVKDDVEIKVIGTESELAEIGYGNFDLTIDVNTAAKAGSYKADVKMKTEVEKATLETKSVTYVLTERSE